jgi:arylsulfatase A-like enzyme
MLDTLERAGGLEHTLVVATSDNGTSFPGAEAQMREHGIHVPLAIMWTARAKPGRTALSLSNGSGVESRCYLRSTRHSPKSAPLYKID